ncbi:DNA helicase UvrD [candidate division WWE3 bacterium CG_4_9_14_3_um_filter_43_9]|uniref:DNA helicase UvrD n=1 Tax=candidate division WWE3 bacterium CG_4_9_14_3_um_filter_43_9 TaxID=1975082 RepID=A0A2M7WXA7_UNCKA|nr:MAG: DNA helicase UvrD [candidate division WWE3 bacterium CG_4_9_14_3_um_filter_43_9]
MIYIADLHIHSKYSRAVSQEMTIPNLSRWGKYKGIDLIGTGDFTHPFWFNDLKENLLEDGKGFFNFKDDGKGPKFVLSAEISNIYTQGEKGRRIHSVVLAPSFADAEKINEKLASLGNLMSDGRPILPISAKLLLETVKEVSPDSIFFPAHIWTPWYSLYGSNSGFDSMVDCFGSASREIFAIETGLSSDPAMNWRIKELDDYGIISFSDAHSLPKLGREATAFEGDFSFQGLREAMKSKDGPNKIAYTIEFHPEEGKYHYTGHRNCKVCYSPEEVKHKGTTCPVCGRKLTVGVMQRVEALSTRGEAEIEIAKEGVFTRSKKLNRPPFVMLVPLQEVIAEVVGSNTASQTVRSEYQALVDRCGSEFEVLLKTAREDLVKVVSPKIVEGIIKNRNGEISVSPGYDGEFGKVSIWEDETQTKEESSEQMSLF